MSAGFVECYHTKFLQEAVKFSDASIDKAGLEKLAEEAHNHVLTLDDETDIKEAIKRLPFGSLKIQILRDANHPPKYVQALEIIDAHLQKLSSSR